MNETGDARAHVDDSSRGPTGLWVPLVTPFDENDQVDHGALDRLARRVLREGASGVVALGTTGEPAVLDDGERSDVIETCAAVCRELGRPLIVGAGTNSTKSTINSLQQLDGIEPVVGALVVVPYYTRPTPAAIIDHFAAVAAASPVPIVAYNVPYRTGRSLSAAELIAIAELPNVVGLKQAVGSLDSDTLTLLRNAPPSFSVLAGDDAFIVPTILMGGAGSITASAHVRTPTFVEMVDAARGSDVGRARVLAERLLPVVEAGFVEPNPSLWKAALHRLGEIPTATLRPPMSAASPEALDSLLELINDTAV
jgi:4-hydroxy-tetrahydrodipicolinate synthase